MDIAGHSAVAAAMPHAPVSHFLDRTTPPHIGTLVLLAGLSAAAKNIFLQYLRHVNHYQKAQASSV